MDLTLVCPASLREVSSCGFYRGGRGTSSSGRAEKDSCSFPSAGLWDSLTYKFRDYTRCVRRRHEARSDSWVSRPVVVQDFRTVHSAGRTGCGVQDTRRGRLGRGRNIDRATHALRDDVGGLCPSWELHPPQRLNTCLSRSEPPVHSPDASRSFLPWFTLDSGDLDGGRASLGAPGLEPCVLRWTGVV